MENKVSTYLSTFGDIGKLSRQRLLDELDNAWIQLKLDNRSPLSSQSDAIGQFYSHPVWVLNGLFSELNLESVKHRTSIASYVKKTGALRVADYGGGSGVLARLISEASHASVDIIEPYPSTYFVERLKGQTGVRFVPMLARDYDLVITQDVLEHVDNPLQLVIELISATRMNGYLIFANCFYPVIKCHLPATFYLRHTFSPLMTYCGLKFVERVEGAEHALVFQRIGPIRGLVLNTVVWHTRLLGTIFNRIVEFGSKVKQAISDLQ